MKTENSESIGTAMGIIERFPALLIPVGLICLWIGFGYLWNTKIRAIRAERNIPTAPFNSILGRALKFIFKEDKYPAYIVDEKTKLETDALKYPKYGKYLVWRNFYFLGLLFSATLSMLGNSAAPYFFGITFLVILTRTGKVFADRHAVLMRMYEVAASELSFPRDDDMNPWRRIRITEWQRLTIPGKTHVLFPAKYKSEDARNRDNFERHFNGTVTDDNTWVYHWRSSKSMITCSPVEHIPHISYYSGASKEWNQFAVGVGTEGEVVWDVKVNPMALVTGTTGAGKSVIQRNIIFHCIQHSDKWRFLGVDLKRVELSPYAKYEPTVMGIATEVKDALEIIRYAKEEMDNRYKLMQDMGVSNFKDLKTPMHALLLMIDEAFALLSPENNKSEEGKDIDAMKSECSQLIGAIARLGRAAGVHMVMATQRPDAKIIFGELKQNLACRIVAGKADSIASNMALDNDEATRLPGIRGRGYIQTTTGGEQFQGYYAEAKWIDKWLENETEWIEAWATSGEDLDAEPVVVDEVSTKKRRNRKKAKATKIEDTVDSSESKPKKGGLLGKINNFNEKHADGAKDTEVASVEDDTDIFASEPVKKSPFGKKGKVEDETPVEMEVEDIFNDVTPIDSTPLIEWGEEDDNTNLNKLSQEIANTPVDLPAAPVTIDSMPLIDSEPTIDSGVDLFGSYIDEEISFPIDMPQQNVDIFAGELETTQPDPVFAATELTGDLFSPPAIRKVVVPETTMPPEEVKRPANPRMAAPAIPKISAPVLPTRPQRTNVSAPALNAELPKRPTLPQRPR